MIYDTRSGFRVCKEGNVIINGVEHFVKNGFVKCDNSLNRMAWNTTEKQSECPVCFPPKKGG